MPFVSAAQRRWGHTPAGMKALGGPAKVAEWDAATKGRTLPERVGKVAMPKKRSVKQPKAPKVSVKTVRSMPLNGLLGFNAAKKISNPLLG